MANVVVIGDYSLFRLRNYLSDQDHKQLSSHLLSIHGIRVNFPTLEGDLDENDEKKD